MTYADGEDPRARTSEVATRLEAIGAQGLDGVPARREGAHEPYSARGITQRFAALFDRVLTAAGRN